MKCKVHCRLTFHHCYWQRSLCITYIYASLKKTHTYSHNILRQKWWPHFFRTHYLILARCRKLRSWLSVCCSNHVINLLIFSSTLVPVLHRNHHYCFLSHFLSNSSRSVSCVSIFYRSTLSSSLRCCVTGVSASTSIQASASHAAFTSCFGNGTNFVYLLWCHLF
jgi:hypothetical protein